MVLAFVTGPVRSGKSRFAEQLAHRSGLDVVYVATAARDLDDPEWSERIERHANARPAGWKTFETAPLSHEALLAFFRDAREETCLIVDATGTWLAARIGACADRLDADYSGVQAQLDDEATALAEAIGASRAYSIVVCEQVGWDVVPVAASARLFRDVLGRMGQRLADSAAHAYLVVAGFAIDLREHGERLPTATLRAPATGPQPAP